MNNYLKNLPQILRMTAQVIYQVYLNYKQSKFKTEPINKCQDFNGRKVPEYIS